MDRLEAMKVFVAALDEGSLAGAGRRVLVELEEAEMSAAGERAAPRGKLTVTAPPIGGEEILRPIINAYLDAFPAVSVNLALHPRIAEPADLIRHSIVTTTHMGHDNWVFPPPAGSSIARSVHFEPRLVVNSVRPRSRRRWTASA